MTKNESKCKRNAWLYFWPECNGKAKPGYVLHHFNWSLKDNDIERYKEWRIEDLEMITRAEHARIHFKGETGMNFGKPLPDSVKEKLHNKLAGRKLSEEWKRKIGIGALGNKASTGYKWWTDGEHDICSKECPGEGWHNGRSNGFSPESIQRMRDAHIGKPGHKQSAETCEKCRINNIGLVWWTNGKENRKQKECPGEGWIRGMSKNVL